MAKKKNTNVNLDHHIPSESLLTKLQYDKVGKSEEAKLHQKYYLEYRDFIPDDTGLSIWDRLRKPEFQRPTFCWSDETIVKLLKALQRNRVIPGVIFWLNTSTGHIFVLDGAHRLSVIRAWVLNDWGDSLEAEEYMYLSEVEKNASERVRKIVNAEIGSCEECKRNAKQFKSIVDKGRNADEIMSPEELFRGKASYNLSTSLNVPIQWVVGDYKIAEESFIDINTGGEAMIPQEVNFLRNRRAPVARAISGITSNGTNSSVWIDREEECNKLAKNLHSILLSNPDIKCNINRPFVLLESKSGFDKYEFLLNLFTICQHGKTGQSYLDQTLSDLYNEEDDEKVSSKTVEVMQELEMKLQNIRGRGSQSIGLLPGLYFYSSSGKYRPMVLLIFIAWFSKGTEREIKARKLKFTNNRELFEKIWLKIRDYFFQGINKGGVGPRRITEETVKKLEVLLDYIINNRNKDEYEICKGFLNETFPIIVNRFEVDNDRNGSKSKNFNKSVKLKIELNASIVDSHKCPLCNGYVDVRMSSQYDHKTEKCKGGMGRVENGRITHPWCNNNRKLLECYSEDQRNKSKKCVI